MSTASRLQSAFRRRDLIFAGAAGLLSWPCSAAEKPRVAIARCRSYNEGVVSTMGTMFDQLGGIGSLVAGKTVAVKIDMSGPVRARTGFLPAWYTHWTHPAVIAATVHLFGKAGAKRVRVLESSQENDHPLEDNFLLGGWDPAQILNAAPNVEMENTGCLGRGRSYARLDVPGGGLIYPAFDFNHSYAECDVLVSLGKMKQSADTGVALAMKNMLSAAPGTIYGDAAGFDSPSPKPYGGLSILRNGHRQPSSGSPTERDPESPRDPGHRLPRVIVDIVRARPVHLSILDGIESQTDLDTAPDGDSRLQPKPVKPGLLVAGWSVVSTDAVAMELMGFDPLARRGADPFGRCDSMLDLAEAAGLGTRDPRKIEIVGQPIASVRFPFRQQR